MGQGQGNHWRWAYPSRLSRRLDQHISKVENLSLLLDKFTPIGLYQWENRQGQAESRWGLGDDDNEKTRWLHFALTPNRSGQVLNALNANLDRWLEVVESKTSRLYFTLETASPLIIGLGGGHVMETDITLDRNTGAPILPGSALKGLARTAAIIDLAGQLPYPKGFDRLKSLNHLDAWLTEKEPDLRVLANIVGQEESFEFDQITLDALYHFRAVFGYVSHVGRVIFMDGIYADNHAPQFTVDIMTPHFGEYYTKGKAPSDSPAMKVIPVAYPVVTAGQLFAFAVLPRTDDKDDLYYARKTARKWLHYGLTELGLGAKTGQGYGMFRSRTYPEERK